MGAIRQALRQRDLRLLLGAGLISVTGDWVLRVGLAYYVYVLTGSTLATALILLSSFVPQIVLGSLAGVFVDRWDSKRAMIASNLLLAAGLLPLIAVRHAGQAWIIYSVLAWEGCIQQFFTPAQQSLLPHLIYGLTVSAQAVGGIVGGLIAASAGNRVRASRLLGWGAVAFGAIDLVMFLYPLAWIAVWPAAVCMVVVGLPGALSLTGAMTLLQRHAADSHRGRVFGALGAIEGIAVVTGTIAAGFLGHTAGIIPLLAAQADGYLAAGLLVLIALRHEAAVRHGPNSKPPPQPAARWTHAATGAQVAENRR